MSVRLVRTRALELHASLGAQNLTNERFAFNFGNPFSGTHFGAARTVSLGLHARQVWGEAALLASRGRRAARQCPTP